MEQKSGVIVTKTEEKMAIESAVQKGFMIDLSRFSVEDLRNLAENNRIFSSLVDMYIRLVATEVKGVSHADERDGSVVPVEHEQCRKVV